ncbi:GNAT family N-acetyltransferase [Bradyrhizobium sp. WBOS7]|uniref:GNAT family N-acetyltransferase n=2 Tax=Nitrobacteraceae TaxID=41294 RepID=A0AAE9NBE6_9BRAD|nr:GNAT family N-acetyltransferase [Bradyrhizobium sp. WBOS2]MDD1571062.1 GNAT family N-acetyltransferase [Bradyrhizobium sp. WBOS1]MDD1577702.1 GNAT family N-acetyltransferase [Bradyrhizobium sp. WBOS7]MDD1600647.1 GNAT family N-acetyltransferase [Bradyrhizobium sp. WBOS16]UUO35308.1 GNAT family N-acetyltransferase [Bradyrhizobium sp. WBOS01]UUO41617.1 GNAT family N-acetyltransferase [Bradyrhizobium sp. WBOS02]UUO55954.1 GNAT family N-acetyltransferase [Bradyrhizobium sp. WBOS07]UUO65945.1 
MTIRSARLGDAEFIARTILSSMRGHRPSGWFDIALGWPEQPCVDFIARIATADAVSMWHVSQFLVAEIDGKPAAALCALPAEGTGPAAWRAIEEVAAATELAAPELEAIRKRGTYTRACWVQGGEGDWMIEHVATDPVHRGRGLVQALIAQALDKGRAAGFARATISFLVGNEPAERAYAKAGFVFVEEKRDPAFEAIIGAPGFRMFARAI